MGVHVGVGVCVGVGGGYLYTMEMIVVGLWYKYTLKEGNAGEQHFRHFHRNAEKYLFVFSFYDLLDYCTRKVMVIWLYKTLSF